MQAIILMGAPGAGKGTAADGITAATDYLHFSTGNILREAIAEQDPVGLEAKAYMEKGELVPDPVIMKLAIDRLRKGSPDARYLFDGFPRTLEQARLLDEAFAAIGARLTAVFLLDAPRDVLIDRIANRLSCRQCGAVYHRFNIVPRQEGVCDVCGGELYQRSDDNEETVRNRLEVFDRQTASLIDYYDRKGLLVRIDAGGDKEDTEQAILSKLESPGP